jgi:hypothetical protein
VGAFVNEIKAIILKIKFMIKGRDLFTTNNEWKYFFDSLRAFRLPSHVL